MEKVSRYLMQSMILSLKLVSPEIKTSLTGAGLLMCFSMNFILFFCKFVTKTNFLIHNLEQLCKPVWVLITDLLNSTD